MYQTEKEQAEYMQAEYDLFAPTFKDNKPILKVLRKAILGIALDPKEKELLKLIPTQVIDRIETLLLPSVTGNEELHGVNDFWFQFNLKDRTEFQVNMDIQYLPVILNFFEGSIQRLRSEPTKLTIKDIEYSITNTKEQNIVAVIARNVILATTEGIITTIHHKANDKPKSEDEIKKILKANSSK